VSFRFQHQHFVCISVLLHTCHVLCPSHSPWFYHSHNSWLSSSRSILRGLISGYWAAKPTACHSWGLARNGMA
jgi:hypothetical protein